MPDDKVSLYKRYLLWLYKTTKEELQKTERKFTQLDIDRDIEKRLMKKIAGFSSPCRKTLKPFLDEWRDYILRKMHDAQRLKFDEKGSLLASYLFLKLKFESIENTIVRRFGRKTLTGFKKLCEEAAIKRILEDASGRR